MLQTPSRYLCIDGHLMSTELVLEEMNSVFHGSKCDWRKSTCSLLLFPLSLSFLNFMQTRTVTEKKKKVQTLMILCSFLVNTIFRCL